VFYPCFTRTITVVIAIALLSACREEKPNLPSPPPSVLVQPAALVDAAGLTVYAGEVRARREVDLAFRVGGKLVARSVDVGATVASGTLLARLDPADLQLNVAAVRAQVNAAESEVALAKAEVDRYTVLAEQKFVSPAVLDAKTMQFKAASARLAQVRAQWTVSDNQASYGELKHDHSGVVTAVLAEVGQVVAAGQPIVRLAYSEEKEVLINVPESRLAELKAAPILTISLWAQPQLKLRGQLRELAPAADPATRTYAARIRLLDSHPALQLGMTAQVVLPSASSTTTPGVRTPLSAVIDRGQGAEVWVVVQDAGKSKVERRPVTVAAYREDAVILSSGIVVGESIVVVGAHKLVAGQTVRPLPFLSAGK
jgi:RND family efflux transporter MFP subunit